MRIAAALLACALVLTGCGSGSEEPGLQAEPTSEGPTSAAPTSPTTSGAVVGIVIKDGKVVPQGKRVKVKVGAPVTLIITLRRRRGDPRPLRPGA